MSSSPLRIHAIHRHPAPYRDTLMDRIAALPGIALHVSYLAHGFEGTPWERQPLRHEHDFPRALASLRFDDMVVGLHPGLIGRLLAGSRPDVVVLYGWADPTAILAGAACRLRGIPYVLGSESWRVTGKAGHPIARRLLVPPLIRGARAWLPTGTRARDLLVANGAARERCHFYPTASDHAAWARTVETHRASSPSPREELGLPAEGVILFVGRLVPFKAADVLVEAFARLRQRGRACELVIVGDGPQGPALKAHRAAKDVRFLGFRQPREVARIMAAADLFVLPSHDETWGAVVGEALAAGIPAIVSDGVGSSADLVGEGGPGIVVPPGDPEALASALQSLLDDPSRRRSLAAEARRRAMLWGHERNLRSFLRAVRDAGATLPAEAGAIADAPLPGESA